MAGLKQPGAGLKPDAGLKPGAGLKQPGAGPVNRTSAMLDDLLNNPLDPGYRLAFQSTQGSQPSRSRRW